MLPKPPQTNLQTPQPTIKQPTETPSPPVSFFQSIKRNLGITAYGPVPTANRFNQADQAYMFDGVDDYLEIPGDPSFALSQFTLLITFKMFRLPTDEEIVATTQTGPTINRTVSLVTNNAFYLSVVMRNTTYAFIEYVHRAPPTTDGIHSDAVPIEINQYYQVAVSYGSGNIRLAINGRTYVEEPILPILPGTDPIRIGKGFNENHPHFFNGVMDDFRLYDWPLTNQELTRLYQLGTT